MRWLPIGCVVVLLFAVAMVLSQQAPGGYPPPSPQAVAYGQPVPSSPPETGSRAAAEPPAAPAATSAASAAPGPVMVASPVPVVQQQSVPAAASSRPALEAAVTGPVTAIQPAILVAASLPAAGLALSARAVTEPALASTTPAPLTAAAPAPTAAPATATYPDNAPTTAREDSLLRDWPYPPIAPATNSGAPALAPGTMPSPAGDPRGADGAERAGLLAAPASGGMDSAARKERQDPLAGWGPPPAPSIDPRRFTEAHWQGIEVIPNTPLVAQALKIPADAQGVIADDVTLPADLQGFRGGDLVTHVNGVKTPDLTSFIDATERVRDLPQAELGIVRDGQPIRMLLSGLKDRLGTANGETASMIPPGARMPHPYRGPCTNCHRIGTTGTIPVDQGDMMLRAAPTIRADDKRPHRDRGPCRACHQVVQ